MEKQQYNTIDIMNKLAQDTCNFIERYNKRLDYDRTYTGIITGKDGDVYTVAIKKDVYHVKSKFNFQKGSSVQVRAPRNSKNNLILEPGYNEIADLIKELIHAEGGK